MERDSESTRRTFLRGTAAAALGTTAVAGCVDDSGTDEEGSGDTPTEGDESPTATPGEPVTDRIRVGVDNTPDEFDANPWTPQDNTTGDRFLTELNGLNVVNDTEITLSGTTVPTPHKPGRDDVEVMTWVEDYSVEQPYDWWQSFDDRATYWNGDRIDAETLVTHNHVAWFRNGNKFVEGATFNEEAEDQWTRHGWFNKGDVPGQEANPVALPILEAEVATPIALLFNPPMHPDFTEPYLEQYRNATSEEELESINSELSGDRITLERLLEKG